MLGETLDITELVFKFRTSSQSIPNDFQEEPSLQVFGFFAIEFKNISNSPLHTQAHIHMPLFHHKESDTTECTRANTHTETPRFHCSSAKSRTGLSMNTHTHIATALVQSRTRLSTHTHTHTPLLRHKD